MPIENTSLEWWKWALLIPSLATLLAVLARGLEPETPGLPPARWTPLDLLLVIFIHFAASLAMALAVGIPFLPPIWRLAVSLIVANSITCLMVLLVAWRSRSLAALGLSPPRKFRNLAAVVVAWLALFIPLEAAYWAWILALSALGLRPELQASLGLYFEARAQGDHLGMALFGFGAVIMAPLAEELFFRGFIFGFFRSRMRVGAAVLLTSAFFALFHGQWEVIPPIFLVGLALNWIYLRTGSLAYSMLFHLLFNGGTLLLAAW